MVMLGSALAVVQAVWVLVATGRRRSRLLRGKAKADARDERIEQLVEEVRAGWGDKAADVSNLEDHIDFVPNLERDKLRNQIAELRQQRSDDGWILTYAELERQKATKARELFETQNEWRRLWTDGVPGLLGGLLALIGGTLIALST